MGICCETDSKALKLRPKKREIDFDSRSIFCVVEKFGRDGIRQLPAMIREILIR
jgi:hypothetical protein